MTNEDNLPLNPLLSVLRRIENAQRAANAAGEFDRFLVLDRVRMQILACVDETEYTALPANVAPFPSPAPASHAVAADWKPVRLSRVQWRVGATETARRLRSDASSSAPKDPAAPMPGRQAHPWS